MVMKVEGNEDKTQYRVKNCPETCSLKRPIRMKRLREGKQFKN